MVKYRTTEKEQRNHNFLIVGFNYCQIQNIERFLSANAYTSNRDGWSADFYNFGNRTICTGYRPIDYAMTKAGKEAIKKIYDELLKLDEKIAQGKIKTIKNTGNWHKCHNTVKKMVVARIEKAITQAIKKYGYK